MDFLRDFGVQPTLLAGQIINFLIILVLLRIFFYKPISKVLNERRQKIAEGLKNAEEIEVKLAQTEEKTAKLLEKAGADAKEYLHQAKDEAQKITDAANIEAKKRIEDALVEAKLQIENQKEEMKRQLEKETLILVSAVVKKLLGRSLKAEERKQLTQKSFTEITQKANE
ncbi:F0F1 ATP synthase subunit B [Candidatus Curtissbacteria bacterium]|nr:F0F1 ATP synthase subunit B [Candidatus Curtissbacteria bacterium]